MSTTESIQQNYHAAAGAPPRPTWNETMDNELAIKVAKLLHDFCGGEFDLDDCKESALKVLKYHKYDDGYQLAKEFEDEDFEPNTQLVEELDSVCHWALEIEQDHVKKWVVDNNIVLTIPIGTIVTAKYGLKQVTGEVVKYDEARARYGIWGDYLKYPKEQGYSLHAPEDVVAP